MLAIFEVVVMVLGAGLAASAAPTIMMARHQTEGVLTGAVVRLVIGGLILMAAWKFLFAENAVLLSTAPAAKQAADAAELGLLERLIYLSHDGWYWVVAKVALAAISVFAGLIGYFWVQDGEDRESIVLTLAISAAASYGWYWV